MYMYIILQSQSGQGYNMNSKPGVEDSRTFRQFIIHINQHMTLQAAVVIFCIFVWEIYAYNWVIK